jgi:Ca2+-dependent lipid-binding protein
LKVEKGENLAVKDKTGTSDPFVEIIISSSSGILATTVLSKKSSIIYKNLNPVWENEYIVL